MSAMRDKQAKFALMLGQFLVWLSEQGYSAQLGDSYRSTDKLFVPGGEDGTDDDLAYSYQELLFYNKRTKVTYSKHNDRLAQDLGIWKGDVMLDGEALRPIGEKWESMGGRWGGRFGVIKAEYATKIGWDAGHFEL